MKPFINEIKICFDTEEVVAFTSFDDDYIQKAIDFLTSYKNEVLLEDCVFSEEGI